MKVLERAETGEWVTIQHCTGNGNGGNGCGSKLEVGMSDLRYYPGVPGDSWGSRDPAVVFKCPVCGSATDLKKSDWPGRTTNLKEATTAWINGGLNDGELSYTDEEVRDRFMKNIADMAHYWGTMEQTQRGQTPLHRTNGLAHSILALIDGCTPEMPALDLVARVHPDDKEYLRGQGEKFFRDETVINKDVHLHDLWESYKRIWVE